MYKIVLDEIDMKTLNDCLVSAPIPYQRTGRLMQNINKQIVSNNSSTEPDGIITHESE